MKFAMRWWGPSDPVRVDHIAQVPGVSGLVSADFDIPVGAVWQAEDFAALKNAAHASGLELEVIESIPVHESIKLGSKERDRYIENYQQSIRNMGAANIPVLCYNFMPIFDWMRTDLYFALPDGSTTMQYDQDKIDTMNLSQGLARLPAWANDLNGLEMERLAAQYRELGSAGLLANLKYFLDAVVPVAEASTVKMALHPDDPPWEMFGIPRIVGNQMQIAAVLALNTSANHGLTFCSGSLGCNPANNLLEMLERFKSRVHFVHARNVKSTGPKTFIETAHPSVYGDVDMAAFIAALVRTGYDGPIRSDHGRFVFGEIGTPGYGFYDRAMGTTYLYGLYEATVKSL